MKFPVKRLDTPNYDDRILYVVLNEISRACSKTVTYCFRNCYLTFTRDFTYKHLGFPTVKIALHYTGG
jgi:hypothetical protein